jgi:hypothetical protein
MICLSIADYMVQQKHLSNSVVDLKISLSPPAISAIRLAAIQSMVSVFDGGEYYENK